MIKKYKLGCFENEFLENNGEESEFPGRESVSERERQLLQEKWTLGRKMQKAYEFF